jgi:hypothetical protein
MIRISIFILLFLMLVVSCTPEMGVPYDEAITAVQGAGYSLSTVITPDMRCLQGVQQEGASVVFMQVYCAIEDQVDMMNFAINTKYVMQGYGKLQQLLDLIGFPFSQEVLDFISENDDLISQGNQIDTTVGSWRVSTSLSQSGMDEIVLVGIRSAGFLDAVGQ